MTGLLWTASRLSGSDVSLQLTNTSEPSLAARFSPPVSFNKFISTGGKSDAFASYQKKNEEQDKYAAVYIYPPDECAIIYIYGAKNILAPCGIKPLPERRYLFLVRSSQVRFSIKPPSVGGYLY